MAWPLEPFAAQLIGRSHGIDARLLASINGSGFVLSLPMVDGSGEVTVDAASMARRTLSAEVYADVDDPRVDPFAAEVRAEYGIVDPTSGHTYWTPVGTFVITGVEQSGPGTVKLSGVDRWQRVIDARLERPLVTRGDTLAAIVALLQGADSRIVVDTTGAPTGYTHGASLWERDRTEPVTKLARSIGAEVYMDPLGVARVRAAATIGDGSVWQIGSGNGGVKVSTRRGKTRERIYNAWAVTGEPDGRPPVYAIARDTRPGSPTRYGGPMGKRPAFVRSSLIRTTVQARAVAASRLARSLAIPRTLQVEALPNPALDGSDVVSVEVEDGWWQQHLVDGFRLPLGLQSGVVALATRSAASTEDTDDAE